MNNKIEIKRIMINWFYECLLNLTLFSGHVIFCVTQEKQLLLFNFFVWFFFFQQFGRWPETVSTPSSGDMIATLQGYVSIMVHNDIRIDITIDRAIRLVNNRVSKNNFLKGSFRLKDVESGFCSDFLETGANLCISRRKIRA